MIKISHALTVTLLSVVLLTGYFNRMLDKTRTELFALQEKVHQNSQDTWGVLEFDVTVTMYNPHVGQTDSTPNETADGTIINPKRASEYRYVALSRDLLSRWGGPFEYGDYIVIEGTDDWDGIYQVRDTMNPKWTNRVDILTTNSRFKYENITMYKYVEGMLVDNSF